MACSLTRKRVLLSGVTFTSYSPAKKVSLGRKNWKRNWIQTGWEEKIKNEEGEGFVFGVFVVKFCFSENFSDSFLDSGIVDRSSVHKQILFLSTATSSFFFFKRRTDVPSQPFFFQLITFEWKKSRKKNPKNESLPLSVSDGNLFEEKRREE